MASSTDAQEWAWAKRAGGQGAERATGVAVDTNSNVYAAGWFESTAQFGTQTLTVTGHRDAFIGRWDQAGNLAWVLKAGGEDEDYASAITVDAAGNSVVLGTFRSEKAEFGGITLTNSYARDYNSLFIVKLDSTGHGIWARQVGGAATYDFASIQTDGLGNIYFAACMARFANFGVTNLSGYEQILIGKYDRDGNLLWARQAGGNGYDYGQGLVVTPTGFAYVTGTFEGTAPFGSRSLTSRGSSDLFLALYSPDGDVQWVAQAGGTSIDANGIVALDPEGGAFLGGYFRGSATIGTNVLTAKASAFDQDAFLARYDGLGNVRWVRQIGHALADMDTLGSVAVKVTTDGTHSYTNIFLTGHFISYANVGGFSFTNTTAQRLWLSKWNLDGDVLWARPGAGDSSVMACNQSPSPSIWVMGQFSDPSAWDTSWLLSAGNSDVYLARFDSAAPTHAATAPAVVVPPQGVTATVGFPVQLNVAISGTAPVTWRWRKNGVNLSDGNRVFGATTARLNINTAQTTDSGNYTVVVSNSSGSVTSAVAVVTVQAPASPGQPGLFVPAWNWVRSIGDTGTDSIVGIATGGSEHIYVTGSFQNTNVIGSNTLIAPKNARNIFLAKYDAQGQPLWAHRAGGEKTDTVTAIASDAQGNTYITGYYNSSNAAFGPYTLLNDFPNYTDLFLAKYNSAGVAQWALSGIGTRDDASRALAIDSLGNILIVGDFASPTLTFSGHVITNIGGTDVFLAKFDSQGNFIWARGAGYSSSSDGNAVAVDAANNVYIAGEIWGRMRFGTNELDSHFDHDTFFAKYDSAGEIKWSRLLGSRSVAIARNLAVDSAGDVIMAGYLDQTCNIDGSNVIAHGSQDVFLAKFNSAGELLWSENMGGPGGDTPRALAIDGANRIFLTGSFEHTAKFGDFLLTTSGQRDAFFVACEPSGKVAWAVQAGGTRSEDGLAIARGPGDSIYAGGSFSGTMNFAAATLSSVNLSGDGFLARLNGLPVSASVSLSCLPPGNRLEIRGTLGKGIAIQSTPALGAAAAWQTLTNFVLQASPTVWIDPQPATLKQKFYRAEIQP